MISCSKNYFAFFVVIAVILLISTSNSLAHSPHDPIDDFALSPQYGVEDHDIFVATGDHILKSIDGGISFKELTNGLDNKTLISSVCLSPFYSTDGIVLLSTLGDGVYFSGNGGRNWKKFNSGLGDNEIKSIRISEAGHIFAIDNRGMLWRAGIKNGIWQRITKNHSGISTLALCKVSPTDVILFGDHTGSIYISNDMGVTIQKVNEIKDSGAITAIAVSNISSKDSTVLIGTQKGGLFKSYDWARTLDSVGGAMKDQYIKDIKFLQRKNGKQRLCAATWNEAMFFSDDEGVTWDKSANGLTTDTQADSDKYRSPHFRKIQISKDNQNPQIFVGGFDGLFFLSQNNKWYQKEILPVSLIKGMDLFVKNNRNAIAISTYGGGAYVSEDLGDSWKIANVGLKTTRLSDIKFSPNFDKDNTIYSATRRYLIESQSHNSQFVWQKYEIKDHSFLHRSAKYMTQLNKKLGLSFDWYKLLRTEPEVGSLFPTFFAISPEFRDDNTLFFGTRYNGIYWSDDGGKTQIRKWNGTKRTITDLVISPDYSNDHTLYASVRGGGVFKTHDAGNSWHDSSTGLKFLKNWYENKVVHQITEKDIKLAISPEYESDGTIYAASSEGFYVTENKGEKWKPLLHDKILSTNIIAVAISPNFGSDNALIISSKGNGLYLSKNRGHTFSKFNEQPINQNSKIEFVKFSPSFMEDNIIIAASREELFITTDFGNSWTKVERPVRYENVRDDVIRYFGEFSIKQGNAFSANSIHYTNSSNSYIEFDFNGSGVIWIGAKSKQHGSAVVYIDGKEKSVISQYDEKDKNSVEVFRVENLTKGSHWIKIVYNKEKNDPGDTKIISIDAFDILP